MFRGNLIIDLQFGSTGKGLIAGYLAKRNSPDTLVTAWAANAGHTYIDDEGRKFIHTMLANGIVSHNLRRVLIGPGSLINPVALDAELQSAGPLLHMVDVMIHPHAAIITPEHAEREYGPMTAIGSTKKGVGEAMIQRIRRNPEDQNVARGHQLLEKHGMGNLVCTIDQYNNAIDSSNEMQIEGAQGFGLSMYHGFYPYTTSRDVSTHQVLADCAIPARMGKCIKVVGTARTLPIRVANRYDDNGEMIGFSGPCYDDQRELNWQRDLNMEPELTTVTKLPRRIFSFSETQLREALVLNGVDELFLNFLNYCKTYKEAHYFFHNVSRICDEHHSTLRWVGMGPADRDVYDGDTERLWDEGGAVTRHYHSDVQS